MSRRDDRHESVRRSVEKASRDLEVVRDEVERIINAGWLTRSTRRRLEWVVRRIDLVLTGLSQEMLEGPDPSSTRSLLDLGRRAVALGVATAAVLGTGVAEGAGAEMYNELRGRSVACDAALEAAVVDIAELEGEARDDLDADGADDQRDEAGFSGKQAAEIVGITYRQLDYWNRTDLIRPSLADPSGSGSRRRYRYEDLLALKLVKTMLDSGIRLEEVRDVLPSIREGGPDMTGARLVVADGTAQVVRSDAELVETLQRSDDHGFLNLIDVESIRRDLDAEISETTT